MFKQGIVGLALALLTATPVLAQMGTLSAAAANTGGAKSRANGEPQATQPPRDLLHRN